jgi:hypothetical protein
MNERVAEIIRNYASKFTETKLFFSPEIPPKKLKNAIKAYAAGVPEKEVLVLSDSTLFGSAKEGFLMNEDTLFMHGAFEKPKKIAIKDIQNMILEQTEQSTFETMLIHVNDPEFRAIAVIGEKDARLFAQMIQEVKRALLPSGTGSPESELVVKEVARVPLINRIRMVSFKDGKLQRYNFINFQLRDDEYGKLENSKSGGLFSSPKVMLVKKDKKVYARTEGKGVFVNDEPLAGERALADRDLISLGNDRNKVVYQYQADLIMAK